VRPESLSQPSRAISFSWIGRWKVASSTEPSESAPVLQSGIGTCSDFLGVTLRVHSPLFVCNYIFYFRFRRSYFASLTVTWEVTCSLMLSAMVQLVTSATLRAAGVRYPVR
jgi:hypothetical protein